MRRVFRDIQSRAPSPHAPRVPQLPWLYTPHARRLFVGMGLMLVSLFGSLTCPATSVAGVEPTAYGDDRGPSDDWNHRSERGLGIIGMIGRTGGRGLHYPIATPCTTAIRVSWRVSASEAPVRTAVAHTAANPAVGAGGHTREPVCSC